MKSNIQFDGVYLARPQLDVLAALPLLIGVQVSELPDRRLLVYYVGEDKEIHRLVLDVNGKEVEA